MKRKKRPEDYDNPDRWMVSYADFITLLFAFFTVLYATSEASQEKLKEFEKSIKKHIIAFGAFGKSGSTVGQGQENNSPIESPIKKFPKEHNGDTEKALAKVETYLLSELSNQELEKYVTEIEADTLGVRLSLAGDTIFEPGTAHFKRSAIGILKTVGEMLKKNKRKVWVEGHMDGESGDKAAWDMSSRRAYTLARYLLKIHKISPDQLASVAYGGERPLYPNNSESNRRKNRRVDLLILTQDSPL